MRRHVLVRILAVGSCLLAAGPAAAQLTPCIEGRIEIESEPGEYIGQGRSYSFDQDDAAPGLFGFFARTERQVRDGAPSLVRIRFVGGDGVGSDQDWRFTFATEKLETGVVVGDYPDAERSANESPGRPGMSVSSSSRGAGRLEGHFTVEEAFYLPDFPRPVVGWIAVEFEQRILGFTPKLRGRVECYYAVPVPFEIDPKKDAGEILLSEQHRLRLGVLGSEALPAEAIDVESLRFGPDATPAAEARLRDPNRDGIDDWEIRLRALDLGLALDDDTLCVDGLTVEGRPLHGCAGGFALAFDTQVEYPVDARFPGRGWFDGDGRHIASNDNTFVGSTGSSGPNNVFIGWDVSRLPAERIRGASLRLGQISFRGTPVQTVEVWDVTTPREVLLADSAPGDPVGIAVHHDLESGVLYGSAETTRETEFLEIPLSEPAVEDLRRAVTGTGYFTVGLHDVDDDPPGAAGVRFDRNPPTHELRVRLGPGKSARP